MENKKVKGSALYLEDGGLIFTPYQNNPEKSPWKKAIAVENGNIRSTNDIVKMTITAKRNDAAGKTFMNVFSSLMVRLKEVL